MSVVGDILLSYRAPREAVRHRLAAGVREDRALAILMTACGLIFVAQWPRLAREAAVDPAIGFDARFAGALFAWLLLMPLVLYVVALVVQWGLRALGRATSGFASRMALFWALLAASPLWLLTGLVAGLIGPGPAMTAVSALALAAFLVFWGVGLSEARREGESLT